jgi:hypothetical protein
MSENIFYYIKEVKNNTDSNKIIDLNELKNEINYNSIQETFETFEIFNYNGETELTTQELQDKAYILENDYLNNYTVKSLGQIMDYYELNKKNLKKDEIIQMLVIFESEPQNEPLVEKRLRLWENIKELKKDKYFSKYIIFDV